MIERWTSPKTILKTKIGYISLVLLGFMSSKQLYANEQLNSRIELLEQKTEALQYSFPNKNWTDRVKFNGFMTIMAGRASNDIGYDGFDSQYSVDAGSLIGLQWNIELTEQLELVAQLIAHGNEDWKPELEWAYLNYKVKDNLSIRLGKIRTPLFLYSNYLDVGFAQPWIRPPVEAYERIRRNEANETTGLDIIYNLEFSNSVLTIQPTIGTNDFLNDLAALTLNYQVSAWTLHLTAGRAKVGPALEQKLKLPFSVTGLGVGFTGAGVRYNDNLLIISEVNYEYGKGLKAPDILSAYMTVGYRFNKLLPYVNFARTFSRDDDLRINSPTNALISNLKRDAYSLGFKYYFDFGVDFKADVTYANNFGNTTGGFTTGNANKTHQSVLLYSVALNAVF